MRILFVTSLYSPFQIELVREVNRISGVEMHAIFTLPQRSARGSHWREVTYQDLADRVAVIDEASSDSGIIRWVRDQIERRAPDVVLAGAMDGPIHRAVDAPRSRRDYRLGFWNEPPNFQKQGPYRIARRIGFALRLANADFVLAIGDRALRYYGGLVPDAYFVPYGEDLSACFANPRPPPPDDRLRFLYSGQLIPRQNIRLLLDATLDVLAARGPRFTLTLAASGPLQTLVDEHVQSNPTFASILRYDRDYSSWEDRLRPFREADVLLYPSAHAGWGLVIPEAMAAGCIPITTRYVEAARSLVRHDESGFVITPDRASLRNAMLRVLDNPELLGPMRTPALASAMSTHAPHAAQRLVDAIQGTRFAR